VQVLNRKEKKILILDGGSSQALPLMRAFCKSGHHVTIMIPHRMCSGFFSRYANRKILHKKLWRDEKNAVQWLNNYLNKNKTDLVLGLSDKTARILSANKSILEKHTKLIVPQYSVFSIAADKLKTMRFCMENRLPCPYTVDGKNIDFGIIENKLKFPVIIKPTFGVGAKGVFRYNKLESLKRDFNFKEKTYGHLIIQEYIPNEEQYTVEAFCDNNSVLKACVVVSKIRYYPVSGGTSSCNVSVKMPEIEKVTADFLKKLGWIGSANLDIIYDRRDNIPRIIEINPRTGAMIKIAFESGVNIADLTLQLAFNEEVSDKLEYAENIVLRNMALELFWFFSSPFKRWVSSKPSFFVFFKKNIFFENARFDDPLTGIGYVLGLIKKYSNIKGFKRKIATRI